MAGPRMTVADAAYVPSLYGLVSVVESRPDPGPHWRAGAQWEAICGGVGTTYEPCHTATPAASGEPPAKTATAAHETFAATPFTVYSDVNCSAPGFFEDSEAAAAQVLTRWEQWQVERAFWTGTVAGIQDVAYPHLASAAEKLDGGAVLQLQASVPVTGAADPATALGTVEADLANCHPGQGIVHIPAALLPRFVEAGVVSVAGAQLRTANGNLVAAGAGYPGTGPAGEAAPPGGGWIYATPPVFLYRGPLVTFSAPSTLHRAVNTVNALSERTVLLGYSCCLSAAPVAAPA